MLQHPPRTALALVLAAGLPAQARIQVGTATASRLHTGLAGGGEIRGFPRRCRIRR